MSIAATERPTDGYVLGHSQAEYERLRAQSRVWQPATGRLLDQVELAQGAHCLDAGCGPGETMRMLAQRVGPAGRVTGVDVDAALGEQAVTSLRAAGHVQCAFHAVDLDTDAPVPGGPFDLVFARLLLIHVGDPVAVLRRLWRLVAPGGHLVVQDYDLESTGVLPALDSIAEWRRVVLGTFAASGRDVRMGHRLPALLASAGLGAPSGTDVAGRLEPLAATAPMFAAVYRSVLPGAVAHGLTTHARAERWFAQLARDAADHPDRPSLWPLLIGAWSHKPATGTLAGHG